MRTRIQRIDLGKDTGMKRVYEFLSMVGDATAYGLEITGLKPEAKRAGEMTKYVSNGKVLYAGHGLLTDSMGLTHINGRLPDEILPNEARNKRFVLYEKTGDYRNIWESDWMATCIANGIRVFTTATVDPCEITGPVFVSKRQMQNENDNAYTKLSRTAIAGFIYVPETRVVFRCYYTRGDEGVTAGRGKKQKWSSEIEERGLVFIGKYIRDHFTYENEPAEARGNCGFILSHSWPKAIELCQSRSGARNYFWEMFEELYIIPKLTRVADKMVRVIADSPNGCYRQSSTEAIDIRCCNVTALEERIELLERKGIGFDLTGGRPELTHFCEAFREKFYIKKYHDEKKRTCVAVRERGYVE